MPNTTTVTKTEYNLILPYILPAHADYSILPHTLHECIKEHVNPAIHILESDTDMTEYLSITSDCVASSKSVADGIRMWNIKFYEMSYARHLAIKQRDESERQERIASAKLVKAKRQAILNHFLSMPSMTPELVNMMFGTTLKDNEAVNNFHAALCREGKLG